MIPFAIVSRFAKTLDVCEARLVHVTERSREGGVPDENHCIEQVGRK